MIYEEFPLFAQYVSVNKQYEKRKFLVMHPSVCCCHSGYAGVNIIFKGKSEAIYILKQNDLCHMQLKDCSTLSLQLRKTGLPDSVCNTLL